MTKKLQVKSYLEQTTRERVSVLEKISGVLHIDAQAGIIGSKDDNGQFVGYMMPYMLRQLLEMYTTKGILYTEFLELVAFGLFYDKYKETDCKCISLADISRLESITMLDSKCSASKTTFYDEHFSQRLINVRIPSTLRSVVVNGINIYNEKDRLGKVRKYIRITDISPSQTDSGTIEIIHEALTARNDER